MSVTERRPQLIRATIEIMMRDGVAAATTRAVATELGIAQPMVNYVYGSKDQLYLAVIEHLTADVTARVETRAAVPPEADFGTVVRTCAWELWRVAEEEKESFQLLNELTAVALRSPSLRAAVADYQRGLDAAFERIFHTAATQRRLQLARPVADVARYFFAGVDGLLVHRLLRQSESCEADERTLEDLVEATLLLASPVPS